LAGGSPAETIIAFNRTIIEATKDLVCAYKPNLGFYMAYGEAGIQALAETRRMIPAEIPAILDAKVGDIGVTSEAFARGYFDEWGFDAVTVQPYLGGDSLEPFLKYRDRGVFVLAKTSNPGSGDLQDLTVGDPGEPLYRHVARLASDWDAQYGSVGLVVGATWPRQLAEIRAVSPELPFLVPGVGTQGGDLRATLEAGLDDTGAGLIMNASRGVIYAGSGEDYGKSARVAATRLRDEINQARAGG
jgi:orotidine-5'-phosphate decarboxylase